MLTLEDKASQVPLSIKAMFITNIINRWVLFANYYFSRRNIIETQQFKRVARLCFWGHIAGPKK